MTRFGQAKKVLNQTKKTKKKQKRNHGSCHRGKQMFFPTQKQNRRKK